MIRHSNFSFHTSSRRNARLHKFNPALLICLSVICLLFSTKSARADWKADASWLWDKARAYLDTVTIQYSDDYTWIIPVAIGSLLVFIYYFWAWHKVGRDPKGKFIERLYHPPQGVSPAVAAYIRKKAFNVTAFTAAVIDLAIKGKIKIYESDEYFSLATTTGEATSVDNILDLPVEERQIMSWMTTNVKYEPFVYWPASTLEMTYLKKLKKTLTDIHGKNRFFSYNWPHIISGLIFSFILLWFMAHFVHADRIAEPFRTGNFGITKQEFTGFAVLICSFALFIGLMIIISALFSLFRLRIFKGGCLGLFSLPFFVAGVILLSQFSALYLILLFCIICLNYIFISLLPANSEEGRRILDESEAFARYLAANPEKLSDRMNILSSAPAMSPELFEQYLPYAVALEQEKAWFAQFMHYMKREGGKYSPSWYDGASFDAAAIAAVKQNFYASLVDVDTKEITTNAAAVETAQKDEVMEDTPANTPIDTAIPREVPTAIKLRLMLGGALAQIGWVILVLAILSIDGIFGLPFNFFAIAALIIVGRQIRNGRVASELLTRGVLTTGKLVKVDGLSRDSDSVQIVTATYEYQAGGRSYLTKVMSKAKDRWYDFDYVTKSPRDLEESAINKFITTFVDQETYAEKKEEQKRQRALLAEMLAKNPPSEQILYDPDDPAQAIVLSVSYPWLEIEEGKIQEMDFHDIISLLIAPALAMVFLLYKFFHAIS